MRWKSTSPYTHTAIPIDKSLTSLTIFLSTNRQRRIKILPDFWATVCITVRSMLSDRCLSCLSVCNVGVSWPSGWMDQDATSYGGRPLPRPHCVRRGPTTQWKGVQQLPVFGPCLCWRNGRPSQQRMSSCTILLQAYVVNIEPCSAFLRPAYVLIIFRILPVRTATKAVENGTSRSTTVCPITRGACPAHGRAAVSAERGRHLPQWQSDPECHPRKIFEILDANS